MALLKMKTIDDKEYNIIVFTFDVKTDKFDSIDALGLRMMALGKWLNKRYTLDINNIWFDFGWANKDFRDLVTIQLKMYNDGRE